METQSPEISQLQEARSEIRLTSEKVSRLYQECIGNINSSNRVYVDDHINREVFNKDRLEENRDTIEKLADQLQPRFFKKDIGNDWHDAVYDKYQTQWAKSEYEAKPLLALISAIGLGRFTTTRKESPIRYVVDNQRYQSFKPKK